MTSFRKPERSPIEIRPVVAKAPVPTACPPFAGVVGAVRAHPWLTWLIVSLACIAAPLVMNHPLSGIGQFGLLSLGLIVPTWIVVQLLRGAKLLKKASEK